MLFYAVCMFSRDTLEMNAHGREERASQSCEVKITWGNVEHDRRLVCLLGETLALCALELDEDPGAVAVRAGLPGGHVARPHGLLARALTVGTHIACVAQLRPTALTLKYIICTERHSIVENTYFCHVFLTPGLLSN